MKSGKAENCASESPSLSALWGAYVDADVVKLPSQEMAVIIRLALKVVAASKETWEIHPMSYLYRSRNRTFFKLYLAGSLATAV